MKFKVTSQGRDYPHENFTQYKRGSWKEVIEMLKHGAFEEEVKNGDKVIIELYEEETKTQ